MRNHLLSKSNLAARLQMHYLSSKGRTSQYHNLNNNTRFLEKGSKVSKINKINHKKEARKRA